jgi:hypothetical protein
MTVIEFLKESKEELFNKLVELEFIDSDEVEDGDIDVNDLMFEVGCYEKGNTLIDSEDICVLLEGFDVSFDKKLVKCVGYDECRNFEFEFKDKKIYCVIYDV